MKAFLLPLRISEKRNKGEGNEEVMLRSGKRSKPTNHTPLWYAKGTFGVLISKTGLRRLQWNDHAGIGATFLVFLFQFQFFFGVSRSLDDSVKNSSGVSFFFLSFFLKEPKRYSSQKEEGCDLLAKR
eukprot:TRINITY_DN3854_c1_g1_i1.p1 TRINITY_DN3854_c1_g1~~TRINITY_DN3854_c1_g1_i1.p1  ORF type:complete len:127 (-),score=15.33 TRINITY_DN3854_c1_g1_i1:42-422(-)